MLRDQETELHGVYLRLAEANSSVPFYCVTNRKYNRPWDALVKIYDGPEYTAEELGGGDHVYSTQCSQYRFPDDVRTYAMNSPAAIDGVYPKPLIGGEILYLTPAYCFPTEQRFGGVFSTAGNGYSWLDDLTYHYQRYGCSGFGVPVVALSDPGHPVVNQGLDAKIKLTAWEALSKTHLTAGGSTWNSYAAGARGISPDASEICGWVSTNSTSIHPQSVAVWRWTGSGYGLEDVGFEAAPTESDPAPTTVPAFVKGQATAVSSLVYNGANIVGGGQIVGWFETEVNNKTIKRGFRTRPRSQSSPGTPRIRLDINDESADELQPPNPGSADHESEAAAIIGLNPVDERGSTTTPAATSLAQIAVGLFRVGAEARAAFWKPGPSPQPPTVLGFLKDPVTLLYDTESAATSISRSGRIVGWSGTGSNRRAFLARYPIAGDLHDLNDKHFVRTDPDWVLEEAVAINDAGHILCNGRKGTTKRAFLLVPRANGN